MDCEEVSTGVRTHNNRWGRGRGGGWGKCVDERWWFSNTQVCYLAGICNGKMNDAAERTGNDRARMQIGK